jgi:hypothetical protein
VAAAGCRATVVAAAAAADAPPPYDGPTPRDREVFAALLAAGPALQARCCALASAALPPERKSAPASQASLAAAAAAGEVREGVLEAALQELQGAHAQRTPRCNACSAARWRGALAAARRRSASADDVARLEAVARAVGMAIERARLPPAALLLNDLLQMQARRTTAHKRETRHTQLRCWRGRAQAEGADAAAVARALAGAFAGGVPAARFAASARMMVVALDAEERCAAWRPSAAWHAAWRFVWRCALLHTPGGSWAPWRRRWTRAALRATQRLSQRSADGTAARASRRWRTWLTPWLLRRSDAHARCWRR